MRKVPIEESMRKFTVECVDGLSERKCRALKKEVETEFSNEDLKTHDGFESRSRQSIADSAVSELMNEAYRDDKNYHWYVARSPKGKLRGIIEFHLRQDGEHVNVDYLATSQKGRGAAIRLMLAAADYAICHKAKLSLVSTPAGAPFYEKLGMWNGDSGFEFSPCQAMKFFIKWRRRKGLPS